MVAWVAHPPSSLYQHSTHVENESKTAKQPRDYKALDIRKRAFQYSLRAIKLYRFLQGRKDGAGWVVGKQYLRCATSIGANIEEAQSAETKADFIHKYGIAQKEARESLYLVAPHGGIGDRQPHALEAIDQRN